ncbi:G5 domain-containing protein [Actinomyces wuliandei]|uniref:G5 domain-containing protein n=1 Tax=Actinomyces wuliandei TaxID=2057743 RepID=UPI000FD6F52F|nr:G5 domain-containing protein [Actinomyces wuliandei]
MGRHSQTSSLNTTLVELGALASRGLTPANGHGRRRAEGPASTPFAPMLFRAGGVAAALSIAVSGGAYAAVSSQGEEGTSADGAFGALGAEAPTPAEQGGGQATVVEGSGAEVSTVTEEATEAHGTVEQETGDLPEGERRVVTEGADGVVRTVYQVTTVDGEEVSRQAVSSVVVSEKVDEVVQVGTGAQEAAEPAADSSSGGSSEEPAPGDSSDTSSSGAGDVQAAASGGTDPASAQAIAKSMMAGYGWDDAEFSCLVNLWNRESNWNYQAQNPSSGAYGIPQALPGSKMAETGSDWQTNPVTQITWGLGYISGRYGTPCSAWAHSESVGWY